MAGAPKLDDAKTLRELGLSSGSKLMLVGSTLDDVLNLEVPPPEQLKDDKPQGEVMTSLQRSQQTYSLSSSFFSYAIDPTALTTQSVSIFIRTAVQHSDSKWVLPLHSNF